MDIHSARASELVDQLNQVSTPIKSRTPHKTSLHKSTPVRSTPTKTATASSIRSPSVSSIAQETKRHIEAIDSLRNSIKKVKREEKQKEQILDEKQLEFLSNYSTSVHNEANLEEENPQDIDQEVEFDEIFQKLSKWIPPHISKTIWEKPLKQWMKLKLYEHNEDSKKRVRKTKVKRELISSKDIP